MKVGDVVDVTYVWPDGSRKEVYRTRVGSISDYGITGKVVKDTPPYSAGQGTTLPFESIESIVYVEPPIEFEDGDIYESKNTGTRYTRVNGEWYSTSDVTDDSMRPFVKRGTFLKK